ncbi:MAG: hypothetical protein P1U67_08120 [Alcanivoracaceae bacterium]|nr:hypothetical protein [Alcanivoracaceae bacterium]
MPASSVRTPILFATLTALSTSLLSMTAQAANGCNPLSLQTCTIPFPSNYWANADASSPTGVSLEMTSSLLRQEVADQLPAETGISVEGIFNGAHGFSAASAVVFEFDHAPDPGSLPKYAENVVIAYDLDAGEFVDVRAQISDYAKGNNVSAPANVLEVYPVSRWNFGHRIVVAVTKSLEISGETKDFQSLADSASGQSEKAYLAKLSSGLAQAGIAESNVRSATIFTVRDQEEVVGPMRMLVERTFSQDHPVRNIEVDYKTYSGKKAALITGELRTDNYRREGGIGMVDFDATPKEQWITFRLTLPQAAHTSGKVPVAFYAHGLGADKSMDALVTTSNAGLGIATFSVDFPNHGDRKEVDGGGVFDNLEVSKLSREIGMMTQHTIDFAAAHKALIGMADLDVLGRLTWSSWCWKCADGIADMDTTRVFMEGTSLGGVLGSSYAALSPDLDGALFHVTGVGVTSILAGSILWESAFSGLEPPAANGAEAVMLKGAVQQLLDYGDSINYIETMRYPSDGRPIRPMMVFAGNGDSIVPNDGTIALAQIVEMPLVGEELFPMRGVVKLDDYDDLGFGVRQVPALAAGFEFLLGDALTGSTAHLSFIRLQANKAQKEWITRFILNQ